jgi:hypothetical protein
MPKAYDYCRKKREQRKSELMVFNLRIFASFAAINYSFSAPPRLCG